MYAFGFWRHMEKSQGNIGVFHRAFGAPLLLVIVGGFTLSDALSSTTLVPICMVYDLPSCHVWYPLCRMCFSGSMAFEIDVL